MSELELEQTPPDSPLLGWGTPADWLALVPLNIHSNAYAKSIAVKSGPGLLYGFTVYSSNAGSQFIQVHDVPTAPANGAIPACLFTVGAAAQLPVNWLPPRTFLYGCFIVNSSTGATLTAGSADCFFDVQFL